MQVSRRTAAIVLAAGRSSRMGSFKPLARLGNRTLVEEAVARFLQAGVADVRVVVGHGANELTPLLDGLGVRWVYNAEYPRGMFSSVLAGVKSLEADVGAFFLLPCDIALVKPKTIRALLDAWDPDSPVIIHPRFDGQRGHPPLIPTAFLREDLSPDYPGGLRALLERCESSAADLDVVDENILLDCDAPSDYGVLLERRAGEGIPTERECEVIWSQLGASEEVMAHSSLVAGLARMLAVFLNGAGLSLNLTLVLAAGLLHDIARGQPDHARAGGKMLAVMGWPLVGEVVATHMDIHSPGPSVNEAELVYFADKCAEEDRLVSLEERFERSLTRCSGRPDILKNVMKRFENAKTIASRIEILLQRPVSELVRRYRRSVEASSPGGRRMIFLARHGAIRRPCDPKRFIGRLDLPLTPEGLLQAERMAECLQGIPLTAVFCSDLRRSADTARIIAGRHGLPCTPVSRLSEISVGRWEGLTFDVVSRDYPEEFQERGRDIVHCPPPGGESFLDCVLRVLPAFHEIVGSTRGNILIVGHAGVNRVILSQVLGLPLEKLFEIDQDYGCMNMLVHRRRSFDGILINGSPCDLSSYSREFPCAGAKAMGHTH